MEDSYQFPCPKCCKPITINRKEWKKGRLFTCKNCGNMIKGHPESKHKS